MSRIPTQLRALGWIGFRARLEDGRWKKHPYQIGRPDRLASNADAAHWRGEGDVREVQVMAPELFDGFGGVLTGGIVFIDLDDVRDPGSGVIVPWAEQLVETFDSWAEVSVSGTGLHIFCCGRLPGAGIVGCLDGDPTRRVEV